MGTDHIGETNMKFYFTGDLHLGHRNILKYAKRLIFMNKDEVSAYHKITNQIDMRNMIISEESLNCHNNTLIKNFNMRVKPEDTTFILGDFCFKNTKSSIYRGEGSTVPASYWEKQLNGKLIFIKGSHDKNNSCKAIIHSMVLHYGGMELFAIHDPKDYNPKYKINLCAHVHQNWKMQKRNKTILINVGVDVWNYKPVAINEILKIYNTGR